MADLIISGNVCIYDVIRMDYFLDGVILDTNPVEMSDDDAWEYCVKNKVDFVATYRTTRTPFQEWHSFKQNKLVSTFEMIEDTIKRGWATEVYPGAYQITEKGKQEATKDYFWKMQPSSEEMMKKWEKRKK